MADERSTASRAGSACRQRRARLPTTIESGSEDGHPSGYGAPGSAQLTRPLTSFVGREGELSDLQTLLSDVRLLTLTGVGGCGTTRPAYCHARVPLMTGR
jgi:hypothetical protein